MVGQDVLQQLQAEGWHLKPEALEALALELLDDEDNDAADSNNGSAAAAAAAAAAGPSYGELRAALLDCDFRKYGAGCLPDDVNRANSSSIKGPMVLQVVSVSDISKPSYASSSGPSRLLLLKLSDGRISCKAMEHKQCNALTDTLLPGTKVVLDQASVKLGVVQLEPKSLRILGGRVDSLAEAWEAQRKYGGINRPGLVSASGSAAGPGVGPAAPGEAAGARLASGAASSSAVTADDGASAPRFKLFVVGKDDSRRSAAAAGSRPGPPAPAGKAPGRAGVAAGTSAAIAAAAVGAATKQQEQQEVKRTVDVAPVRLVDAQAAKQQAAAQAKLLDKLERSQAEAADSRGRGRGRGRGRRGRRGRNDSDDEGSTGITLEEYEAQQRGTKVTLNLGTGSRQSAAAAIENEQLRRDEELARQLQAELDLEEAGVQQQQQHQQRDYGRQHPQQGYDLTGSSHRGRGRKGPVPVQYEQYSQQQRRPKQPNYGAGGVDYTEAMFDNFDYNAGRGRSSISRGSGRGRDNSRGGQRGGRGYQGSSGRHSGSGDGPASSRGRGGGFPAGRGRGGGR